MMRHVAAALSASILVTGCYAKIHELPSQPESAQALFAPLPDQDFMVGLAVSGGGSRAAAFAAAALEALAELPVTVGTEKRSVLETVSYMNRPPTSFSTNRSSNPTVPSAFTSPIRCSRAPSPTQPEKPSRCSNDFDLPAPPDRRLRSA